MSARYRIFTTPPEVIARLPRSYMRRGNREFWSLETAHETYHGFYTEEQATRIAIELIKRP